MALAVDHQTEEKRFVAELDGHVSVLQYELAPSGVVDFYRTYVPDALRGRGVAGDLVAAGLDWARLSSHRVVPSCSYVAAYIERHPAYADLVAD
jgi:predicted GNAT family acetyltransferase